MPVFVINHHATSPHLRTIKNLKCTAQIMKTYGKQLILRVIIAVNLSVTTS